MPLMRPNYQHIYRPSMPVPAPMMPIYTPPVPAPPPMIMPVPMAGYNRQWPNWLGPFMASLFQFRDDIYKRINVPQPQPRAYAHGESDDGDDDESGPSPYGPPFFGLPSYDALPYGPSPYVSSAFGDYVPYHPKKIKHHKKKRKHRSHGHPEPEPYYEADQDYSEEEASKESDEFMNRKVYINYKGYLCTNV